MPLDVRILGASQPLSAGRRYDLLCQSSGSRPPASIMWKLDGQRLERTKETVSGTKRRLFTVVKALLSSSVRNSETKNITKLVRSY